MYLAKLVYLLGKFKVIVIFFLNKKYKEYILCYLPFFLFVIIKNSVFFKGLVTQNKLSSKKMLEIKHLWELYCTFSESICNHCLPTLPTLHLHLCIIKTFLISKNLFKSENKKSMNARRIWSTEPWHMGRERYHCAK